MAEIVNNHKVFSLYEVTRSIQKTIEERYQSAFWIKAEINKLNHYKHSGHYYPDLVEKNDGKIIAQLRSTLWNIDAININKKFIEILKEPLREGIKVLIYGKISYDSNYGLSIKILDIDPSYTLGDLEREKQESIQRLIEEKIFNLNKSKDFPILPKRIAIISVETSKGYADFKSIIDNNTDQFKLTYELFPSLLQGDKAVGNIIRQLSVIKSQVEQFDVVVIIRGGGGEVGLSCFNNYLLAKEICEFPIPILTGIGHATNETVSEMVAYENAITPTKLAETLLQHFKNFKDRISNFITKLEAHSNRLIEFEVYKLRQEAEYFNNSIKQKLQFEKNNIDRTNNLLSKFSLHIIHYHEQKLNSTYYMLKNESIMHLENHKNSIKLCENTLHLLNPIALLNKGYSITTQNNKIIKSITQIDTTSMMHTHFVDGQIDSIITKNQNV